MTLTMKLRRRLLAGYAGATTLLLGALLLSGAASAPRDAEFDRLTVRRIDFVEPDGTPRLVISDKAEFPGGYYHGREMTRPGRKSAGMLFVNDEGTENGGLMFGGYKDAQGARHSYGHLSFDRYEQDQAMSLDSQQDGRDESTRYVVNDLPASPLTPALLDAWARIEAMPDGPGREAAARAFGKTYPGLTPRGDFGRQRDGSVRVALRDAAGRMRASLSVSAKGEPALTFYDAKGRVVRRLAAKGG
ncbi:MAG: hypothetical protein KGL53_13630 [Elusimicrobia bacterium]|nr:hypothetical protein [Elusimicrobiota bacterium]